MRRRSLVLIPALLVLSACGGDDKKDAEQTVKDFVKATNERDAKTFCNDLVTDEFLEQSTGAKGDQARKACEQQLGALRGLSLKLDRIKKSEIDGDTAKVTATLETQGQTRDQVFRLKKEDGDWRLAGGSGQ